MSKAITKAIWLQCFLKDLNFSLTTIQLYCDNDSGIDLVSPTKKNECTKHIDMRYHYIRERVKECQVEVLPCSTHDNTIYILTNGLIREKHEKSSLYN